jgi:hypothetical protein
VIDIVENIGYSRSAVTKAIRRHPGVFKGLTISQPVDTRTRGEQQCKCLNEEGIKQLIMLMEPGAQSNPDLYERVEAFKARVLRESPVPAPVAMALPEDQPHSTVSLKASLLHHADIADILIERWGYSEETARRLAMAAVVEEVGDEAAIFKGPAMLPAAAPEEGTPATAAEENPKCRDCIMLEADPDFDRYFSLEKVAAMCAITKVQAQNILEKQDLIAIRIGVIHLTRLAESLEIGRVFTHYPLAPHRMNPKKIIRYSPKAIERVKAALQAQQAPLIPGEAPASG